MYTPHTEEWDNPQSSESPVMHKLSDDREYLQAQAEKAFKSTGKKYDECKRKWHLLPFEGTEAMVEAMEVHSN